MLSSLDRLEKRENANNRNKVVGEKVVLSSLAGGRNGEKKLKGLEGWEGRLG